MEGYSSSELGTLISPVSGFSLSLSLSHRFLLWFFFFCDINYYRSFSFSDVIRGCALFNFQCIFDLSFRTSRSLCIYSYIHRMGNTILHLTACLSIYFATFQLSFDPLMPSHRKLNHTFTSLYFLQSLLRKPCIC
jgi:hypothetical protein